MLIMPANNSGAVCRWLAKASGKIGWLISPNSYKVPPAWLPYAIDNGAFMGFDERKYFKLLDKVYELPNYPLWVVVPDKVADSMATLKLWDKWQYKVSKYGFPLAFAAQDGCKPSDVPEDDFCVFVGGGTHWKVNNAAKFKGVRSWLHIGRVNQLSRIALAKECGADSVDGTGFFRGNYAQLYALLQHCADDWEHRKLPLFNKVPL